jgi:hypothetical protein
MALALALALCARVARWCSLVQVRVSSLPETFRINGVVGSPVDNNVRKWEVAVCLSFHGELDDAVTAVQTVQEVVVFFWPMRPDHERDVNIWEAPAGLACCSVVCSFLKIQYQSSQRRPLDTVHQAYETQCLLRAA